MERTSFFSVASTGAARVCGRLTLTPCWMSGAVTMKMMSSTSITSTIGVTLISLRVARPGAPLFPPIAMGCLFEEVAFDDVEEVGGEVGHLGVEDADAADEGV